MRHLRATAAVSFLSLATFANVASAETIPVGPSRTNKTLQDVQGQLRPGDVVELDGDATYPGGVYIRAAQSGTAGQKITIRGLKVGGKRPVISGGGTGVLDGLGMVLNGSHYVLESLEVTGSASTCVVHKGDDITIRDFVVHDCPGHGLLGHDDEAGSLLLEGSEFYKNGSGTYEHQIYMATGQEMYPGSVFRMQNCYVHDGSGGNNVKSRSERNEIYYNWIEGAYYHGLELIGADKSPATPAREDSDVVGNVIAGGGSEKWHLVRVGGDKEEADTSGRYRFVNNTFVVPADGAASVVRIMLRVDTVEMHNNAFVRIGGGSAPLFAASDATWVNGASLFGSNNWVQTGLTGAPGSWSGTLTGDDPGVVDLARLDLRPAPGSGLLDKGGSSPASPPGRAFPSPLAVPLSVPPARRAPPTTVAGRALAGVIDIGAFEFGSGTPPGSGGPSPSEPADAPPPATGGAETADGGASAAAGSGAAGGSAQEDAGCGCRVSRGTSGGALASIAVVVAVALLRRRRTTPV